MPPALSPRAELVHRLASAQGFALVGIGPAKPSEHAGDFQRWLDAGKHGEMDYLARYADLAIDPDRALPGAKSIICVADWYGDRSHPAAAASDVALSTSTSEPGTPNSDLPSSLNREPETRNPELFSFRSTLHTPLSALPSPTGRIARYAQGDDYHWVIKDRLHALCDALRGSFPDHLFRAAVDTAPIMEREHAARAGLGWVGKHTLLIHPQMGSWFMLGVVLTTLPVETSADAGYPPPTLPPGDHCGSCTRCIEACPTQCITPYSVDGSRCISYLTIEHRSAIDVSLHPMMRNWLAGCDVCQEVCPYNGRRAEEFRVPGFGFRVEDKRSPASPLSAHEPEPAIRNSNSSPSAKNPEPGTRSPEPSYSALHTPHSAYAPRVGPLPLLDVLNWSEDDRRAAFKGTALKRIKLDMIRRNALIALGNWLHNSLDANETERTRIIERIGTIAGDEAEPALVRTTAVQVLSRLI